MKPSQDPYADFRQHEVPSDDAYAHLDMLIQKQLDAEKAVAEAERDARNAKKKLADIRERELPDYMAQLGLTEVVTQRGIRIRLQDKFYAGTSPKNDIVRHENAMQWLEDNDHGGLIKRMISVSFNRMQQEEANGLVEDLKARNFSVNNQRTVHPSTLKSWVKTMLEEGKDLPMDLFGVVKKTEAKIG